MTVQKITSKHEFDEIVRTSLLARLDNTQLNPIAQVASGKVVFIDFYADWCGPCKMISPFFEELAGKNTNDDVVFCKADIEKIPEVASELGIQSIPTFHAFKNGERIDKFVGANRAALSTFVQTSVTRI
ncbi:thioredoxin-like protein [Lanmaoa asiatica]|nr:thioredoxin-like protein [Lanmaoa asiatica]